MAWAVLLASLAVLAWFQRNDVRGFKRFGTIEDSRVRQRIYLRWAAIACAKFLGMPLLGLALLGRLDAIWSVPEEFWDVGIQVPEIDIGSFLTGGAFGALIGCVLVGAWIAWRRGKPAKRVAGLNISPMLPRNRSELLHIVPLVLNAGISEEIFFRVYLPLLLTLVGANGWVAFGLSTLIFGALHRYQGWLGVLVITALGALFAFLYLGGWGLTLPIVVHLVINANSLLFRPALQRRFQPEGD